MTGRIAHRARAQSRAAAPGADAHGHQASVLVQSAAARVSRRSRRRRPQSRTGADALPARSKAACGEIGASGKHFCFDNETPRHRTLVEPYALADRLVTNGEYLEFIRDGGYRRAGVLAVGWLEHRATAKAGRGRCTGRQALDAEFTLRGCSRWHARAPVCHLSYYEADAFARWAGARLPTEAEWELAAGTLPVHGNLLRRHDALHPLPAGATSLA